jgi:hypothetical protein
MSAWRRGVYIAKESDSNDWRALLRAELAHGGGLERLTEAERLRIEEGRSFEGLFDGAADVRPLAWQLPGSKCEIAYVDGDPSPWCRCTTTIPAAVEAVLEGIWELDSEAMRYHPGVEYRVLNRPSVHSVDWMFRARVVPVLPPFEWPLSGTWIQSASSEFLIVFLPAAQIALSSESNSASTRQLILLKAGACPNTTDFTYLFQTDFGSDGTVLERFLTNMQVDVVRRHRAFVASIKGHFQRQVQAWLNDVEDDGPWRERMVKEIQEGEHSYTAAETALLAKGVALLDSVQAGTGKVRQLTHSKTVTSAWTKQSKKSGLLLGHVEATVRASTEQIVACLMHFDSKINLSRLDPTFDVRYEILEVRSLHHIVVFFEIKSPPFQNRTFLQSLIWQKVSDVPLTYVWVNVPIAHHDKVPPEQEAHALRALGARSIRCTHLAADVTKIHFACSLDLRGAFPRALTNALVIPQLVRVPYDLQMYFLQVLPSSECTPADGICKGNMIADVAEAAPKGDRAAAIRTFVMRSATLRTCGFATLDAMLIGTLATQRVRIRPKDLPTHDPSALTETEAETIGRRLDSILRLSATHIEAVDALIRNFPALAVTAQQHAWFRPMLETIAKRRMARAPFGLKLRLAIGVWFSVADMLSDIYSTLIMLQRGQVTGAQCMIVLIGTCLAMQLFVAVLQTKHRGWHAVVREVFLVLSLIKPGVDAIRFASGAERIAGVRQFKAITTSTSRRSFGVSRRCPDGTFPGSHRR